MFRKVPTDFFSRELPFSSANIFSFNVHSNDIIDADGGVKEARRAVGRAVENITAKAVARSGDAQ